MAALKWDGNWQMNWTGDLFIVVKDCIEPVTLFKRSDIRGVVHYCATNSSDQPSVLNCLFLSRRPIALPMLESTVWPSTQFFVFIAPFRHEQNATLGLSRWLQLVSIQIFPSLRLVALPKIKILGYPTRRERCTYELAQDISLKWNANSLVQGLNTARRVHFLWR